jgi:hypothetical protein
MGQACFVECGEILQRDFAKSFSMQRFVPILVVAAALDEFLNLRRAIRPL